MNNKQLKDAYIPFQCMVLNAAMQHRIEEVGTAQYYILESLYVHGTKAAKELAVERGVSPSGISKLNKKLLDKGFIMQERNEKDRRFYTLSITDEGKAFLRRAQEFRGNMLEVIEKALDTEELLQFSRLCEKITKTKEI